MATGVDAVTTTRHNGFRLGCQLPGFCDEWSAPLLSVTTDQFCRV